MVAAQAPVSADQTFNCVSAPALSTTRPDGKNLAVNISPTCPDNSL